MQKPRSLPLCLLTIAMACAGGRPAVLDADGGDADAGVDAGEELEDAGPDAGCNLLDPACPCPENFHRCGARCRFDQDPDYCGAACEACPSDEYSTGYCDGQRCQVSCKSGSRLCGDRCLPEDGNACGPTCMQCPTVVNGAPACVNGQCAISCASGFSTCGDGRCGAAPDGQCTADADCCRGRCGPAGVCCALPGTACNNMNDCNGCFDGAPLQCVSNKCCVPVAGSCASNSDCCTGHCDTAFLHTCFAP